MDRIKDMLLLFHLLQGEPQINVRLPVIAKYGTI